MIPDLIAVVILMIPWCCLAYIFRGESSEDNPIWGNVVAAGISLVVCGMAAIWFFSGTIVSPSIVVNTSYQVDSGLSVTGNTTDLLGPGGSGMFILAPVSSISGDNISTAITVYTYDIVYQQYQNFGLMLLYLALFCVSLALFLWFIVEARKVVHHEKNELELLPGEE